jgi:uncharacterized membrane protein
MSVTQVRRGRPGPVLRLGESMADSTAAQSPFGVPWRSAIIFVVVVAIFLAAILATLDPDVGTLTWAIRIIGTIAWLIFAGYLGYRDIVKKKGGGPEDIDHVPFDRWSWIHISAGAVFGVWSVPFVVVVVITIGWEFFEKYVPGFGEKEILANRAVDVVGAWAGWLALAALVALIEGKGLPFFAPAADAWIMNL